MIYYWQSGRVQCPVGICKGCKCKWHDADLSKEDMIELCEQIAIPVEKSTTGDLGVDVNRMWYTASLMKKDRQLKKLVLKTIPSSADEDSDDESSESGDDSTSTTSSGTSDSSTTASSSSGSDSSSEGSEEDASLAKRQRKDKGQPRGTYTPTTDMDALRLACKSQGLCTKGSAMQLRKRVADSLGY
jgi:hypothetical protein